jgi:hypothetical protein
MKKLLLALGLCLALSSSALSQGTIVGPGNLILCTKIANMAVGPTTITTVIAAVTGQTIHLCGWHITNTGATGTFSISYGTGAACVTGTTVIVTVQNVTSTAPSADHPQYATFSLPPSNALCVTPSVATIAATIYYAQF